MMRASLGGMRPARHRADPAWSRGLVELARLLLPTACPGCGVDDVPLCDGCRRELAAVPRSVGQLSQEQAPSTWCRATYDGHVRDVVLAWKDQGRHDLSPVVAAALAGSAVAALTSVAAAGRVLLVPAPSSRAAVRVRGGDLLAQVADTVAVSLRRRGWDVASVRLLRQRPGVRDQSGLGVVAREGNVHGSFVVRPRALGRADLPGSRCLLLDDVVTTGATLAEAARALDDVGCPALGAAVVAATPLRLAGARSALTGLAPGLSAPGLSARGRRV